MSPAFVIGLRHGPPGAPESITAHGLLKQPGSDFTYSYANPAHEQRVGEILTEEFPELRKFFG